jgi:uncharacterized protein (DUF433 family)
MQIDAMTFKRITCDPKRMNGQPCVRQLRLTVRRVVEAVATYPDRGDLQREYPELEAEDIREALAYAAANLDDKVIELATRGGNYYSIREHRARRRRCFVARVLMRFTRAKLAWPRRKTPKLSSERLAKIAWW